MHGALSVRRTVADPPVYQPPLTTVRRTRHRSGYEDQDVQPFGYAQAKRTGFPGGRKDQPILTSAMHGALSERRTRHRSGYEDQDVQRTPVQQTQS